LSVQDRGQDAKKIVIPLALARSDLGMVILEEAPDLSERYQIIDLQVREIPEHDAGAGVELPILLELGVLRLRNQSQNTDEGRQKTSHRWMIVRRIRESATFSIPEAPNAPASRGVVSHFSCKVICSEIRELSLEA
jgi:hypothetical protein